MQLAHGGGGCSHDTTLAALTQGAWRRSEPSGEAVRRRPATGSRTPTPNEHAHRGSPAGGSHSACSRAIGKKKPAADKKIEQNYSDCAPSQCAGEKSCGGKLGDTRGNG